MRDSKGRVRSVSFVDIEDSDGLWTSVIDQEVDESSADEAGAPLDIDVLTSDNADSFFIHPITTHYRDHATQQPFCCDYFPWHYSPLEADYKAEHEESAIVPLRLMLVLGVFFFLLVALGQAFFPLKSYDPFSYAVDGWLPPLILTVVLLIVLLVTFRIEGQTQIMCAVSAMCAGATICIMKAMANSAGPSCGMMVLVSALHFQSVLLFYNAVPICWLLSVGFQLFLWGMANQTGLEQLSSGLPLHITNLLGTIASYLVRRHVRRSFLRSEQLARQHALILNERARQNRLLENMFPKHILDELRTLKPGDFICDRFEGVSVLFADVVGFTQFSQTVTPERLTALLNDLFKRFDAIATDLKVEKIKTIGDCYMCVCGHWKSSESKRYARESAVRMAEMALAMVNAIGYFNDHNGTDLKMRLGFHTGTVTAGVIGLNKFCFDIWGVDVGIASRMESEGEPNKIQVSQDAYELLRENYEFIEKGELKVSSSHYNPNRQDSIRTWFLSNRKANFDWRSSFAPPPVKMPSSPNLLQVRPTISPRSPVPSPTRERATLGGAGPSGAAGAVGAGAVAGAGATSETVTPTGSPRMLSQIGKAKSQGRLRRRSILTLADMTSRRIRFVSRVASGDWQEVSYDVDTATPAFVVDNQHDEEDMSENHFLSSRSLRDSINRKIHTKTGTENIHAVCGFPRLANYEDEQAFQSSDDRMQRRRFLVGLVLAIIIMGTTTILEYAESQELVLSGLVAVCSGAAALALLSCIKPLTQYTRAYLFLSSALTLVLGAGVFLALVHPDSSSEVQLRYFAPCVLLVFSFAFGFGPIRLSWSIVVTVLLLVGYLTAIAFVRADVAVPLFLNLVSLVPLLAVGIVGVYEMEHTERKEFVLIRLAEKKGGMMEKQREKTQQLLLSILPKEILTTLEGDLRPFATRFTNAAIMFAKVDGLLDVEDIVQPREFLEMLNVTFVCFDKICVAHGIEKIKTIGTVYMAAAGLPTSDAQCTRRITSAAMDFMAAIEAINKELNVMEEKLHGSLGVKVKLSMRVGIHTGAVVAGVIGSTKTMFDLWGDTVNTAARMQMTCPNQSCQISEASHATIQNEPFFSFERREPFMVKGKGLMSSYIVSPRKA